MRAVIQRVGRASVTIDGREAASIGAGFLILLGIHIGDTPGEADFLAQKCADLRVFEDGGGKMNLALGDVDGAVLVVSQFTLYGNCRKGNRPSFTAAARPETATPLYERFVGQLRGRGLPVQTGEFGADMKVELLNDGPVTILMDTDQMKPKG